MSTPTGSDHLWVVECVLTEKQRHILEHVLKLPRALPPGTKLWHKSTTRGFDDHTFSQGDNHAEEVRSHEEEVHGRGSV